MKLERWLVALALGISANGGALALAQGTTTPPPISQEGPFPQPVAQTPAVDSHGKTFWNFVEGSCDRLGTCGSWWSQSPACQLAYNVMAPVRALSGGLLPDRRNVAPTQADLARLQSECASPVEILATKIQLDEANAHHRIAAIRYLGTRDGYYWHEAEEVLLASLRADRNECVRYEAAKALAAGCCCTPRVLEKLNLVIAGSDADGNPGEKSERVKSAACAALQRCLAQRPRCGYLPAAVQTLPPPEMMPAPREFPPVGQGNSPIQQMSLNRRAVEQDSSADQALRSWAASAGTISAPSAPRPQRSLLGLMQNAAKPRDNAPPAPEPVVPKQNPPMVAPPPSHMAPLTPIGQIPANAVSMPAVLPISSR